MDKIMICGPGENNSLALKLPEWKTFPGYPYIAEELRSTLRPLGLDCYPTVDGVAIQPTTGSDLNQLTLKIWQTTLRRRVCQTLKTIYQEKGLTYMNYQFVHIGNITYMKPGFLPYSGEFLEFKHALEHRNAWENFSKAFRECPSKRDLKTFRDLDKFRFEHPGKGIGKFLLSFFWDQTPEGFEFWSQIDKELKLLNQ